MATEHDIKGIVDVIAAAYPNWNRTELTIEVYYQTLKEIPTDELRAATFHCIAEVGRKFAPSVGELREAVSELRGYISGVKSSFEAWGEVQEQMRVTGSYREPVFSHPLIAKAVGLFGWRELCLSENPVADRARFIQCYDQLQERADRDEMLLPEVRGYLEVNGVQILAPSDQIRQLADRMKK